MSFRFWELFEYPVLPNSTKYIWTVKTSNQFKNPRFVILALQSIRKNKNDEDCSKFNHLNLSNVKLFLNSQYYPYHDLNLDILRNNSMILYNMYCNFQAAYYGKVSEPLLDNRTFINNHMLVVIDCSKQNDSLKNTPVDVRIEMESRNNWQQNTAVYCLILHDRIIAYNPTSGEVRKQI